MSAAEDQKVFDYWKEQRKKNGRTIFDGPRKKAVKRMRELGFTTEDMMAGVRGIAMSPHNMGQNDRHTVYDDLSLICRDAAHLERFIALDPEGRKVEIVREQTTVEVDDGDYCQACHGRGVIFGKNPEDDRRCACQGGSDAVLDWMDEE